MMFDTIPYTSTHAENVFFLVILRLCGSWWNIRPLTQSVKCLISWEEQKAKLPLEPSGQVVWGKAEYSQGLIVP